MTTNAPPSETSPATRSGRWATAGWLASSALLVVVISGIWMQVRDDQAGATLASAIITGDRPVAPALPSKTVAGSGADGLPTWYQADGSRQAPGAPGAQVMVVNWWASWCGPCEDEAPLLRALQDDYDGRIAVVGIDAGSQDLERDARDFIRRHELQRLSMLRGDRADEQAWGVNGFPETFVVGSDGRISGFVNGPLDDAAIRALVDAELQQDRSAS